MAIQNAPREDPDQTAGMRRLIWIFAGRTCPKVRVFWQWGSFREMHFNFFFIVFYGTKWLRILKENEDPDLTVQMQSGSRTI